MNIGYKKLIAIQVVVDGDLLNLTVGSISEITQFAAAALGKNEMKWVLVPQIPTILNSIVRDSMFNYFKNFNVYGQNYRK